MFDALFETPLAEYEDLYASYFRTYCSSAVASDDNAHRGIDAAHSCAVPNTASRAAAGPAV